MSQYTVVIQYDPRDEIYVATVPELLGCSAHGATYQDALDEVQDAIETWLMGEDPAKVPAPVYYPQPVSVHP